MERGAPPVHNKRELRAWSRAFRRSLPPEVVRERSARICASLLQLEVVRAARGVLLCMAFDNEPDAIALAVDSSLRARFFIPRAVMADRSLAIHPYPCALTTSRFGIPEPAPGEPQLAEDEISSLVDVAIVPGLAFDERTLVRVGYGGGFFDRFLARHAVTPIGIGYDETLVAGIPFDAHDVPMSAVVTDGG